MNDTWVIRRFSYVCKMLQKIISYGVTNERRVPKPYLNSINVPASNCYVHLTSLSDVI